MGGNGDGWERVMFGTDKAARNYSASIRLPDTGGIGSGSGMGALQESGFQTRSFSKQQPVWQGRATLSP